MTSELDNSLPPGPFIKWILAAVEELESIGIVKQENVDKLVSIERDIHGLIQPMKAIFGDVITDIIRQRPGDYLQTLSSFIEIVRYSRFPHTERFELEGGMISTIDPGMEVNSFISHEYLCLLKNHQHSLACEAENLLRSLKKERDHCMSLAGYWTSEERRSKEQLQEVIQTWKIPEKYTRVQFGDQ